MIYLWIVVLILSALLTLRFIWSVLDDIGYKMGTRYWCYQTFYGICLSGWWIFWGRVFFS